MIITIGTPKYIEDAAKILADEWYDSLDEAIDFITLKFNQDEFIIARDGSKVVGVLLFDKNYSPRANYCHELVVKKNHRKKGIGVSLLKKFIEVSKINTPSKQNLALSSTDVNNLASIKTHEKVGFENLGVIKNIHYGTDEIFFGYDLDNLNPI